MALAGGGAKGIAHVGALSALESRQVQVRGYSGTSAGAIVAALAAAGFRAEEIVHPTEPRSIIDYLRVHNATLKAATDLFGPNGWPQIALLRTLLDITTPARLTSTAVGLAFSLIVSSIAMGLYGFPLTALLILFWMVVVGVVAVGIVSALLGLSKLNTLRQALADLLSAKVFPEDPKRPVLFRDFDGNERPALKIVAANLTRRRLELFSADTSPCVEVADAVAASICLPIVFDLWRFQDHRFVDGGVVSNLPAWPFDEERALDPDAMTIAFAIGEPENDEAITAVKEGRMAWLPSLVETTLSGSTALSMRAVGPSELITLRPRIKMMDFDLDSSRTRELLRDMTANAIAEIDERLFTFPDTYRAACRQGVQLGEQTLDRAPYALTAGARQGRVRVAAAIRPEGYQHALRLRFGANFEDDPDQDIVLPIEGSLVGVAWLEQTPQFDIAPFPVDLCMPREEHRPLRRLIWGDLAWSLRVPIFGIDGTRHCIVTMDGSDRLNDTPATREVFEGLADEISRIFTPVVQRLKMAGADGKA